MAFLASSASSSSSSLSSLERALSLRTEEVEQLKLRIEGLENEIFEMVEAQQSQEQQQQQLQEGQQHHLSYHTPKDNVFESSLQTAEGLIAAAVGDAQAAARSTAQVASDAAKRAAERASVAERKVQELQRAVRLAESRAESAEASLGALRESRQQESSRQGQRLADASSLAAGAEAERDALRQELKVARERAEAATARLDTVSADLAAERTGRARTEANFKQQLQEQERLTASIENSRNAHAARCDELQRAANSLREEAEAAAAAAKAAEARAENAQRELSKHASGTGSSSAAMGTPARGGVAGAFELSQLGGRSAFSTPLQQQHFHSVAEAHVDVASPARQLLLTDLQRKNNALAAELAEVKHEKRSLEASLEHILGELEMKAESLHQHNQLLHEHARMSQMLDDLDSENAELKNMSTQQGRIIVDLREQLQGFLGEHFSVEGFDGGKSEDSAAQQRISRELVRFADIVELQERNEQLLIEVREVTAQKETNEAAARDKLVASLTQELETVRREQQLQLEKARQIVAQRDVLMVKLEHLQHASRASAKAGSTPGSPSAKRPTFEIDDSVDYPAALHTLQSDFDEFRVESRKQLEIVTGERDSYSKDYSQATASLATLKVEKDVLQEKVSQLEFGKKYLKDESDQLRSANTTLVAQVGERERTVAELRTELSSTRSELSLQGREVAEFRARLASMQASEHKFADEIAQLRGDLERQVAVETNLVETLRMSQQDWRAQSAKTSNALELAQAQVSRLRDEQAAAARKHSENAERAQLLLRENQRHIHQLTLENSKQREELAALRVTQQHTLDSLDSAKEAAAAALGSDQGSSNPDSMKVKLLISEREKLKEQLALANVAKEHAEKIADAAEQALHEAASAGDQIAQARAEEVAAAQDRASVAEDAALELAQECMMIRQSFAALQEKETNDLIEHRNTLEELRSLQQTLTEAESTISHLRGDAETAHRMFTTESQARTSDKGLLAGLKSELEQSKRAVEQLKATEARITAELADQAAALNECQQTLDGRDRRIQELQAHNERLVAHLSANLVGESGEVALPDDSPQDVIIGCLRSDKETLAAKNNLLMLEHERLKQNNEALERELEAARSRMEELRQVSDNQPAASQSSVQREIELDLLRETNASLRVRVEEEMTRAGRFQDEISKLRSQLHGQESEVVGARGQQEVSRAEIARLQQTADRWKQRSDELLAKFKAQSESSISTDEVDVVRQQLSAAESARDELRKQLAEAQQQATSTVAQQKNDKLRAFIERQKAGIFELNDKLTASISEVHVLQEKLDSKSAEVDSLEQQMLEMAEEVGSARSDSSAAPGNFAAELKQKTERIVELEELYAATQQKVNTVAERAKNHIKERDDRIQVLLAQLGSDDASASASAKPAPKKGAQKRKAQQQRKGAAGPDDGEQPPAAKRAKSDMNANAPEYNPDE